MITSYNKIFVTSSPSFYKNRLFQEISKRITIFVIFTGANEAERNKDFYKFNIRQGLSSSVVWLTTEL